MDNKIKRLSKKFWVENEGVVYFETGFECPPNKDVWYFPKPGFSVYRTGKETKESETLRALNECERNVEMWTERLNKLSKPPRKGKQMRELAEQMSKEIWDGQVIEDLIPIIEKYLLKAKESK